MLLGREPKSSIKIFFVSVSGTLVLLINFFWERSTVEDLERVVAIVANFTRRRTYAWALSRRYPNLPSQPSFNPRVPSPRHLAHGSLYESKVLQSTPSFQLYRLLGNCFPPSPLCLCAVAFCQFHSNHNRVLIKISQLILLFKSRRRKSSRFTYYPKFMAVFSQVVASELHNFRINVFQCQRQLWNIDEFMGFPALFANIML